jgi:hypothetical protein
MEGKDKKGTIGKSHKRNNSNEGKESKKLRDKSKNGDAGDKEHKKTRETSDSEETVKKHSRDEERKKERKHRRTAVENTSDDVEKDHRAKEKRRRKSVEKDRRGRNAFGKHEIDKDCDLPEPKLEEEDDEPVSDHFTNMFVQRGFLEFYRNPILTDLVLKFGDSKEYQVHKLIAAHSSAYLYRLLKQNPSPSCIEVSIEEVIEQESDELMDSVISYMYTGAINFTENNCIVLLSFADKYEMNDLMHKAVDNIERENAVEMLKKALAKNLEGMVDKCIEVIARNFCYIYDADYSFLSPELFNQIVSQPKLNVLVEYELFEEVIKYIRCKGDNITRDQIDTLMQNIRFRWFTTPQIHAVSTMDFIAKELVIEALLLKLNDKESDSAIQPFGEISERMRPREKQGITFAYKSHYKNDPMSLGKGILWWLATDGGRSPHKNPHQMGRVIVQASSVEKGVPLELVGNAPSELWTKDVPSSWFSINFGDGRVRPTSYCLRHGGNYRADSLRTWDFQGSIDGECWVTLRRYVICSFLLFLSS